MNTRRFLFAAITTVTVVLPLLAQLPAKSDDPSFDVASIKPTRIDRPMDSAEEFVWLALWRGVLPVRRAGRFTERAIPLSALIQMAYDVWGYQIEGVAAWVRSARYAIDARASGDATFEQMRPMLRTLLADRFKLVLHRERRTLPIFELVPANGGLKFAAVKAGGCITFAPDSPAQPVLLPPAPMPNVCGAFRHLIVSPEPGRVDRFEAAGIAMSLLINALSAEVGRLVIDRTGFTERFSFRLDFAPTQVFATTRGAGSGTDPTGPIVIAPSLSYALKEQLGLDLKPSRGSVEVLVIDHAEQPTPD